MAEGHVNTGASEYLMVVLMASEEVSTGLGESTLTFQIVRWDCPPRSSALRHRSDVQQWRNALHCLFGVRSVVS
jgi:hypothetical protein